jgi:hypothetical protein
MFVTKKTHPDFYKKDGKNCYEKEITCFQVTTKYKTNFLIMKTYLLLFQKKICRSFLVSE